MDLAHFFFQHGDAPAAFAIGNSLRFRGAQWLERTFTSSPTGGGKTSTTSFWLKRGSLPTSGYQLLFSPVSNYLGSESRIAFNSNTFHVYDGGGNPGFALLKTSALYRDPNSWMHIVIVFDTGNSTSSERQKLYINGSRVTAFSQETYSGIVEPTAFYQNQRHRIGARSEGLGATADSFFEGYISEFHGVDGQALEPTEFGETNDNGVWVPRSVSIDDYGTNGFYLSMDPDNTDTNGPAGATRLLDQSPNDNHWVMNGFELANTASTDYDWMPDSPTQNYRTINSLQEPSKANLSKANLDYSASTSSNPAVGFEIPATGKWYWEVAVNSVGETMVGVQDRTSLRSSKFSGKKTVYYRNGTLWLDGVQVDTAASYGNGSVIGVAMDCDTGVIKWYKDTSGTRTVTISDTSELVPIVYQNSSSGTCTGSFNFGQRPFVRTPPAGFEPLQTQELPAVDITNPSDHFEVITDTGANILASAQAKFPNGLWWIKDRVNSNQHQFVDTTRGGSGNNLTLQCPAAGIETSYSAPSGNSVAWCWNADDYWTNSAGTNGATIQSEGRRDLTAGFSIVDYTGEYQSNTKIAHGLNQAPEFMIVKNRQGSNWFFTYHSALFANQTIPLNGNGSAATSATIWASTRPTDTLISVGQDSGSNANNNGYIIYAWHSVPGYSAFGSYTGNGNADGPFIYTGFKPAFVLTKSTGLVKDWHIWDNKRDLFNPSGVTLYPNDPKQEGPGNFIDLLSNGFKARTTSTNYNSPGDTIIQ